MQPSVSLADPPSISAFDPDVVKLTAQFVARNSRQFLTNLMNREQRNFQFDFLRPQHSLFQYFTKLLEQYTKVLIPPKDLQMKLDTETEDRVLKQVNYRMAWLKHQEANRRRQEEALEREGLLRPGGLEQLCGGGDCELPALGGRQPSHQPGRGG